MTKIDSFVFFAFPPDGSGVARKLRIDLYFASFSAMTRH